MRALSDGFAKTTQGKPAGLRWAEGIRNDAYPSRFRDRDLSCYEAFGHYWREPAVQRYVLTGTVPTESEGFDPYFVEAVRAFDELCDRWRPARALAEAWVEFAWQQAQDRSAALADGQELAEVCDYRTGEVSFVRCEPEPPAEPGAKRGGECPYPGVIRGGLADRATSRARAPVSYRYREETR